MKNITLKLADYVYEPWPLQTYEGCFWETQFQTTRKSNLSWWLIGSVWCLPVRMAVCYRLVVASGGVPPKFPNLTSVSSVLQHQIDSFSNLNNNVSLKKIWKKRQFYRRHNHGLQAIDRKSLLYQIDHSASEFRVSLDWNIIPFFSISSFFWGPVINHSYRG